MVNGTYTATYQGKSICGFMTGHNYEFELSHNERTYELYAYKDNTDDVSVDLNMRYASEISIKHNWELAR